MKRSVRLVLKKETLSDLTSGDLRNVVGGADDTHGFTCSPTGLTLCGLCLQPQLTSNCPTVHRAAC